MSQANVIKVIEDATNKLRSRRITTTDFMSCAGLAGLPEPATLEIKDGRWFLVYLPEGGLRKEVEILYHCVRLDGYVYFWAELDAACKRLGELMGVAK